ncbi:MAG: hypothetical protein R3F61_21460 [Myxococcota bacterium]
MPMDTQLTTVGNLDPKLASALCYVPVMSVNLIASAAFFITEKENRTVRFHAAQGLLVVGAIIVSAVVFSLLTVLLSVGGGIVDAILGLGGLLSILSSLLVLLISLVYILALIGIPFGLAAMAYMEKPARVPMLAGFAERMAGLEAGWND